MRFEIAPHPSHQMRTGRTLEQWLTHIESVHFRSIDLQLDRIERVLRRLLPTGPSYEVISVAGTNGKGSAVETITTVLCRSGLRVGTYTSPHLVRYNERIRINRESVSDSELCDVFADIDTARTDVPLTYFEFGTLAAVLIFERRAVDIAVLEVGMGGRLDAVNAVEPEAALITNVAIDHQHWLGPDRETIAVEKAGIFRGGRPAVCADPDPPAAISACADRVGARLYQIGRDFGFDAREHEWDWTGPEDRFLNLPRPRMHGTRQLNNAAGALMVLMSIRHRARITDRDVRTGLLDACLRGRFEILEGRPGLILDVAHNVDAVTQLRDNLEAFKGRGGGSGRTLAVCGMLKDKPVAEMSEVLAPAIDAWYAGTIDDPRGHSSRDLGALIEAKTGQRVRTCPSVPAAFEAAVSDAEPRDIVLVFGSFHTVGDILRALETDSVVHRWRIQRPNRSST